MTEIDEKFKACDLTESTFADSLLSAFLSGTITEKNIKDLILATDETKQDYEQNALLAAIVHIIVREKLATEKQIEKLKEEYFEQLIDRDVKALVEQYKKYGEIVGKNDK